MGKAIVWYESTPAGCVLEARSRLYGTLCSLFSLQIPDPLQPERHGTLAAMAKTVQLVRSNTILSVSSRLDERYATRYLRASINISLPTFVFLYKSVIT